MEKHEEKIEEDLKAEEKKEGRSENWTKHPLFVACVSYGLLAAIVLILGNYLQMKNWIVQEKLRSDLNLKNWRKQNEIISKDRKYQKRSEMFKKYLLLFKERESYIWNLRRARIYNNNVLITKYWERLQDINRQWRAFTPDFIIYFDEHAFEMSKNFLNAHKILHDDLEFKIGTKGEILNEKFVVKKTKEAAAILDKNNKFFLKYLLDVALDKKERVESISSKLSSSAIGITPFILDDLKLEAESGVQAHER